MYKRYYSNNRKETIDFSNCWTSEALNETEFKFVHPENASVPIYWTVPGSETDGRVQAINRMLDSVPGRAARKVYRGLRKIKKDYKLKKKEINS